MNHLIEDDVGHGHHHCDQQRHARPADAVEESEHAPHRDPEDGTRNARQPEGRGELLDLRIETERPQQQVACRTDGDEQRQSENGRPQRCPDRLGGTREPAARRMIARRSSARRMPAPPRISTTTITSH